MLSFIEHTVYVKKSLLYSNCRPLRMRDSLAFSCETLSLHSSWMEVGLSRTRIIMSIGKTPKTWNNMKTFYDMGILKRRC